MGKQRELDFLFNPGSIAVVGASDTPGKLSAIVMESLGGSGFTGGVYPVNPKYETVRGLKCYPSIKDIGAPIDLAVVAVPAAAVSGVFKEAEGKLRGAVVVSGGFGETDDRGKALEDELRDVIKKTGIRVVGPNCMGIYDAVSGVDTFFIPVERIKRPGRGSIAVLSQSGSFALTAMDELAAEGVGVSRVLSYGNMVDVSETDCLDFLARDDATETVVLYIESIKDGRRFVESAKNCARRKTVMALKVGRGEVGRAAARSHTGAMAGRDELYSAAFKKAGVVELSGYEEFMDGCKAVGMQSAAKGRRVAVITDAGGIGVNVADACVSAGLEVSALPDGKKERLKAVLPSYFTVGNPLDLTGSATDEWFAEAVGVALDGDDYDLAIVAPLWGPPGLTDRLPELLAERIAMAGKPAIICSPGGKYSQERKGLFTERGLPVFASPESAVRAAAILARKGRV
ncbi:MAG: CoA-binding protein [Thermodesulfobacteriota bacterium]